MAIELRPVQPRDAIEALITRGQQLAPSFAWQEVYADLHATMFTVAKSHGHDILEDIFKALLAAIEEGKTYREFAKELTPILKQKGWWGRTRQVNPATGLVESVQLGSPRRLELIFDANMRVSYAAGHWASFERNKAVRPFLRYVAIMDERTRPTHALHHNLVLPVDHPYWNVWAPPCGWSCRCTLQSLAQADVDALGAAARFTPPQISARPLTNKVTGETRVIPDGIDPGWDHNPGKAGFTETLKRISEKPDPLGIR